MDATYEEIDEAFKGNAFSRLPIYDEDIDHIVGIIYYKDFYQAEEENFKLDSIIKKPMFVMKHKLVNELLKEFQTNKQHFAVVADEFGSVAGIVTMEDILEEIVGEIWDEYDEIHEDIKKVSETVYIVSGKANIDKVLEQKDEVKTEDVNLPAVIGNEKSKKQYVYCVVKKKSLFGKVKEKQVKFKINDGLIYIPKKYNDKIISAVIPEGVTKINGYAFKDLIALKKVSLPSTLVEIEKEAFKNCIGLKKIEFPDSLKKIGEAAFSNCEYLEDINLFNSSTYPMIFL